MYRMNGVRLEGTYRDKDLLKILLWIAFCVVVIYVSFQVGQWRVASHYSATGSKIGRYSNQSLILDLPRWIQVDLEESQLPLAELDSRPEIYATT